MIMRKYLKPALEIEAFDVEDVIATVSIPVRPSIGDGDELGEAAAPIELIELN